jgi:hypothetical protein
MEETLRSDKIRNVLVGESVYGSNSDHESNIDSNIGKQFEQYVVSELRSEVDNFVNDPLTYNLSLKKLRVFLRS